MRGVVRAMILVAAVGGMVSRAGAADPAAQRVTWSAEIAGRLKAITSSSATVQVDVLELERVKSKGNNQSRNNNRGRGNRNRGGNAPRFRLDVEHKEFTYALAEDLVVRRFQPVAGFDDKGNIKKYTAAELRELKGPGNLPGYPAARDDLRAGQVVDLFLAAGTNGKPKVVMALILTEAQGPPAGAKK